ncbi:MAG: AMP-dependent synthetase/ligase [Carbonactinosporaceae bacterium]
MRDSVGQAERLQLHRSIPELFFSRIAETPAREAYRYPVDSPSSADWHSMTWQETGERVRAIAAGLLSLGLELEQRAAILATTRVEWILADLGILAAGGATTTVYPTTTAEEAAFIVADSESRYVFAEDDEQIAKLRDQRPKLSHVERVVTFDGTPDGDWVLGLADLEERGRAHLAEQPSAVDDVVAKLGPEHLSTLMYTSGTTGRPKGVRLVHECWTYEAEAQRRLGLLQPDDVQYLWLPLSHSFGRVLTCGQLAVGFCSAVDGRIPKLVENLPVVQPTFMAAAPRIFEKVYNRIVSNARAGGPAKYKIFTWAVGVGKRASAVRQQGREPTGLLALQYALADRLVFAKIKAVFGGRLRSLVSGSAPLSKEIAEFFHAAGVLILEGYGLTETSAGNLVNRDGRYRFGTVGLPMPGTEVRIAADGEVLLRSPGVMRGYHNLPELTAEVLTEDGWFHTGDIGEIDDDGFLRITDRKKDLIKTSGGKYVAPQYIEGQFKAICPYVSQIIVHGAGRNYCTALVTLDAESIPGWAAEQGMEGRPYGEIVASPQAQQMVQGYVDELNNGLQRWETVKRFAILPRDLTIEDGELTPSLKVKRRAVEDHFAQTLEGMYVGAIAEVS